MMLYPSVASFLVPTLSSIVYINRLISYLIYPTPYFGAFNLTPLTIPGISGKSIFDMEAFLLLFYVISEFFSNLSF